ncbi:MAG: PSD1 domain-containing protein [Planctomycetes bacterium]|nr:PSD1 domain-containing protein [Planctomycetota bacterium]
MLLPLLLLLQASPSAQQDDAQEAFFEARVRPVLAERCYGCHSHSAKKLKGNLYLDTREGWQQGGDSGPAIVAGEPDQSALVRAVRYDDSNLQMPPKAKLAQNEIDDLVAWVRAGAYDPRKQADTPPAAASKPDGREHWAFQPVRDEAPPAVRDESWVRNPIDRFVLARLEAAGIAPAPSADKRTLLRRATYDLVGLPPTSAELAAFEADDSPQAFERVVDRLLASPHYGERWGRRWLDLARYSDSNGLDENLAMANAWRYRDWVVSALNRDLPYDQFVAQQLAGDLLPKPADEQALGEQLAATGFLVLGPKVLAEQDKEKLVMDVVDEEIDVSSKALLGVTLACARCHDHKFDPWTARDYYSFAGIFKSTKTLANLDFVSRWNEVELATDEHKAARDEFQKSVKEADAKVAALVKRGEEQASSDWPSTLARSLLAAQANLAATLVIEAESFARGNVIIDRETWGSAQDPIVRTGNGQRPQFAEWEFEAQGPVAIQAHYAAQDSRPVTVLLDGERLADKALGEVTGSWFPEAQRWRAIGSRELRAGRHVLRLECATDLPHLDAFAIQSLPESRLALRLAKARLTPEPALAAWVEFTRGEPGRESPLSNLLLSPPPSSLEELAARYQLAAKLVLDEWRAKQAKDEKAEGLDDPANELLRKFLIGPDGIFTLPADQLEASFPEALRTDLAAARAARKELDAHAPAPIVKALGAREGEIVDVPVHIRGSHLNKAPSAEPRGFPALLCEVDPPPAIPENASGRLEFAQWLADPKNPLFSRVMVNRIWQGHFGQGIVRTPSNFGLRGEPPTNPELLDWLASEFVRQNWSIKAMHRLVMLSSAYRMGSDYDEHSAEVDPENRLNWRMNRRRLEAEAVRDSLLAASGRLDETIGGSLLPTKDGDYVTNDQSADAGQYMSTRRSLYLPVIRNSIYDLFATFDYADPSMAIEARSSTTDPSQALLLLNSPLAVGESEAFAHSLLAQGALDDTARLGELWQRAYQRAPREAERMRAVTFLADHLAHDSGGDARLRAWESLCRALCASNEFLYVD